MAYGLPNLTQSIREAEALLRTIPASQLFECEITFYDNSENQFILFYDHSKKCLMLVKEYKTNGEIEKPLDNWDSIMRIKACEHIPDLLAKAKSLNPTVLKKAEATSILIRKAISKFK